MNAWAYFAGGLAFVGALAASVAWAEATPPALREDDPCSVSSIPLDRLQIPPHLLPQNGELMLRAPTPHALYSCAYVGNELPCWCVHPTKKFPYGCVDQRAFARDPRRYVLPQFPVIANRTAP